MFRNNLCLISENVSRRYTPSNSQFLKQVMHEEEKIRQVRAQEILMTSENPMAKEQKHSEQICRELQILEREKFLEEKRRLLLQQNEDEIRELMAQIKRANVQKALIEQKIKKENQLEENLKERLEEKKRFAEELQCSEKISLKEERENAEKKTGLRQELLKQMQEKEKQQEEEKRMINREREQRQKLLENIQKDMNEEKQYVLKFKEILRSDRDEYLREVELYRNQQKSHAEEDHRKYLAWLRQRDEEERLRTEKRKQAMKTREELSESIGQQVLTLQEDKQKRENLLLDLLIGERLAKDERRCRLNFEKQKQQAENLRDDFLRFFAGKQQAMLSNRQKEKLAYQQELEIFQNLVEAENAKKTLLISSYKQYREDLLNTIAYKKCQRELEAEQSKAAVERDQLNEAKHQQAVEAEKLCLLKAEPLENLKFLPSKAISEDHRLMLGLTCKETKENTK